MLDTYSCQGGAAKGYRNDGWEVFAVDNATTDTGRPMHQKRSAADWFHHGDALKALDTLLDGGAVEFVRPRGSGRRLLRLGDVDAAHGSPPCQLYSITNAARQDEYPDLIDPTRERFEAMGVPWVIENVERAPLRDPITLCWTQFYYPGSVLDTDGEPLMMTRHRLMESNVPIVEKGPCDHVPGMQIAGSYGGARRQGNTPAERRYNARHVRKGGYVPDADVQQRLLEIDWMTTYGMFQSIPPVYAEWVGSQLRAHVQ